MNGLINLIKPVGMTSNQVVGIVKRYLKTKKVGHAGSLDPLACGVLPIMLGRATKLFEYTLRMPKEYVCELEFGTITDTLDTDGVVISETNTIPRLNEIKCAINNFIGEFKQIPPKYSALKFNGVRMYDLARRGVDFEIEPRNTAVYDLKLLYFDGRKARFYIKCKSGFYVRSFCRDIAFELNSLATMTALIRKRAANLDLGNSITIEHFIELVSNNDLSFINTMDTILSDYDKVFIDDSEKFCLVNGMTIKYVSHEGDIYRVYHKNQFLGLAKSIDSRLKMDVLLGN